MWRHHLWTHLSAGRTRRWRRVGPVSGLVTSQAAVMATFLRAGIHRADIDGGQIGESRSPVLKVGCRSRPEDERQGPAEVRAPGVVGGAAAEPDDDALGSGTDGRRA